MAESDCGEQSLSGPQCSSTFIENNDNFIPSTQHDETADKAEQSALEQGSSTAMNITWPTPFVSQNFP